MRYVAVQAAVIPFFVLMTAGTTGAQQRETAGDLTLDGKLDDSFWRAANTLQLTPAEPGVPAALGGEIRVKRRGGFLCLAARLPEPGGKVLAHSVGRNPIWEIDVRSSPPVEDRIVYTFEYRATTGAERDLAIAINPWGAYRVEENGRVVAAAEILRAAEVTPQGWTVEAALPSTLFDVDWAKTSDVKVKAERIRSRRAQAPEYRWEWPGGGTFSRVGWTAAETTAAAPVVRAPAIGNTAPPFEVGRTLQVPPAVADWDSPAWSHVPEFHLSRNEPFPRAPRTATRVKWMHDGRKLALFFYVEEPEPIAVRAKGPDSTSDSEDHVAVYLATSGSAVLQIAVNPAGEVSDAIVSGPRWARLDFAWKAHVEVQTDIRHGHWIARVNIPLEECAAALGEAGVPSHWRILVARHRAERRGVLAETDTLPVLDGSSSFFGPLRYQALVLLNDSPGDVKVPSPGYAGQPRNGLAGSLAALEPDVWSPLEHRYEDPSAMLSRYLQRKILDALAEERRAWEQVKTRADWERFRDDRMQAFRKSLGQFPPERPPLDVRITARHQGDGYTLENLVFQSRPGFYVTANLYLPQHRNGAVPGIVLVHSQHFPKTEWELQDSGVVWARAGAAVLVMERPGFGERAETNTWYRQAYASRFTFMKQLYLVGESDSSWGIWDVMRSVDFLWERPEIDRQRIILLGAVAGGGDLAGQEAALDSRVAGVIPYNFDQGHLRVHGDLPGQMAKQFSPWLICASVAPRTFVRPFEFGWETSEETDVPSLWVDGMERSQKVWGFYGAQDSLTGVQGYGLLRDPNQRRSPCENLGPEQRAVLYPVLERWFGIALPPAKDQAILPSSELSTNADRDGARRQEAARLRPDSDLLSISPSVAAELQRKPLHQIAYEMGRLQLAAARERRQALPATARARQLREELRPLLGDIEPAVSPKVETRWTRAVNGARAEALVLQVEEGIKVPMLLLLPQAKTVSGVVVGVAQGGKERFLAGRADGIAAMLEAGVAVCLPDVRGTGETAFPPQDYPYGGLVQQEFDLSRNLLGSRLKDLRTVLAYLRSRGDVGRAKVALWGESFAATNPEHLYLDELESEVGPQIERRSDPMGAHLALLAGLYEEPVSAVAVDGGLAGYLSMLEDAFTYTPADVVILGVLKAGDIADIAGAIAPRPVLLTGLVGGRNIAVPEAKLAEIFEPARFAYQATGAAGYLNIGDASRAAWLIERLC